MSACFQKHGKKLKYPRVLLQPIARNSAPRRLGLLAQEEELAADKDKWIKEKSIDKLRLLARHYGVAELDSGPALELAFRLAIHWVPGFEVVENAPRGKGAPKKDTASELDRMVREIDSILEGPPAVGITVAAREFKKRNTSSLRWKSVTPRTIENKYRSAKTERDKRDAIARALFSQAHPTQGSPFGNRGLFSLLDGPRVSPERPEGKPDKQ